MRPEPKITFHGCLIFNYINIVIWFLGTRLVCNVIIYLVALRRLTEFQGYQPKTFPGQPSVRPMIPEPRRLFLPPNFTSDWKNIGSKRGQFESFRENPVIRKINVMPINDNWMCFIVLFIKNILTSLKISIFNLCFHDIVTCNLDRVGLGQSAQSLHRVCRLQGPGTSGGPSLQRALAAAVLQAAHPGLFCSPGHCVRISRSTSRDLQRFCTALVHTTRWLFVAMPCVSMILWLMHPDTYTYTISAKLVI